MPSLLLPSLANQQPQQAARVNTSTELGRMLVATVTASQTSNPVNERDITLAAGVSRVQTPHGIAFQHSASNGNVGFGVPGGLSTLIPIGTGFSVYMRLFVPSLGVRQGLMTDHDAAGSNESYTIEITAANEWKISIQGGANAAVLPGVTVGWHDLLVVYRPGVGHQIYVDGAAQGFLFTTSLAAGTALRLGSFGVYTTLGFQGRIAVCHIFRGDVAPFWARLIDNPWQIYAAPPRRLWMAVAGGVVDTQVVPGAAAVTLTGYAPSLAQTTTRTVSPPPANLTLTGYAPTVTQNSASTFSPAPAAVALTGYAPTVARTANQSVSPAPAQIVLTGYAPTVTQVPASQVLTPPPAALTLTGFAPTLTQTGQQSGGGGGIAWLNAYDQMHRRRHKKRRDEDEITEIDVAQSTQTGIIANINPAQYIARMKKAENMVLAQQERAYERFSRNLQAQALAKARALQEDEDDVMLLLM